MSLTFSFLCVCLLSLLSGAPELRAFEEATHNGTQWQNPGSATNLSTSEMLESPFPYNFPNYEHLDNLFPMPDCDGLLLEEATVDYLQNAMNKGQLTSTKIALCYLQRIYQTNEYTK